LACRGVSTTGFWALAHSPHNLGTVSGGQYPEGRMAGGLCRQLCGDVVRVPGREQDDVVVEIGGKVLRNVRLLNDGETRFGWSQNVRSRATEVQE
jgi:hypothetical protein